MSPQLTLRMAAPEDLIVRFDVDEHGLWARAPTRTPCIAEAGISSVVDKDRDIAAGEKR